MATSSLATWHLGSVALLAATLLRCGLSADGQGALSRPDGGSQGSSSGLSSGGFGSSGDDGGESSGSTSSSSSGAGTSSGFAMDDASGPFDAYGNEAAAPPLDGSASGGHPGDGGAQDGAPGMFCSRLNSCCTSLQQLGASAMSVMSCQQSAQSGNESGCAFLLGTFQSAYLCLGV